MKKFMLFVLSSVAFFAYAGGNNDQVKFPANYKQDFTHYDTRNRVGAPQLGEMYANTVALETAGASETGDGSIVIMEIYKANTDADGNPVTTESGLYEKGAFAAVAVMEKRSDWGDAIPENDRAGDWGFALYTPDGQPKENDLDCATCHQPLGETNFMFSYSKLLEHMGN